LYTKPLNILKKVTQNPFENELGVLNTKSLFKNKFAIGESFLAVKRSAAKNISG
jgi:hypothetical protein